MGPEFAPPVAPLAQPLTTTHRVISYTYDSLYRLTAAEHSTGEFYQYAYDAVGNRLSLTTTAGVVNYQYDAANRLLVSSSPGHFVSYTWDANGNLLNDGVRSYSYDHANRLTQVVSGTVTTQFTYDGLGNRTATTVDGVTTRYALDVAGGLPEVIVATTGRASTQYLQVEGQILAQYDSGTWAYILPDHLGSVRAETDALGQVTVVRDFDPFGVSLQADGGSPFGYTGEWWDSQAELLYLRARYYQPQTGRFITEDPFPGLRGEPQTQNRFVYVTNNVVNKVDPKGLYGEDVHQRLTFEWAWKMAMRCGCDPCMSIMQSWLIAEADLWVDDPGSGIAPVPIPIIGQPEKHFLTREQALDEVKVSIRTRKVWGFGKALHQLQDTFSHWEEGYTLQPVEVELSDRLYVDIDYGHGLTSLIKKLRSGLLTRDTLAEYRDDLAELLVQKRYPRWYVETLSGEDLFDLCLREYTEPRSWWRKELGYNTDLYSPWSGRDMDMEVATKRALKDFFTLFGSTRCDLGQAPQGWEWMWDVPPEVWWVYRENAQQCQQQCR